MRADIRAQAEERLSRRRDRETIAFAGLAFVVAFALWLCALFGLVKWPDGVERLLLFIVKSCFGGLFVSYGALRAYVACRPNCATAIYAVRHRRLSAELRADGNLLDDHRVTPAVFDAEAAIGADVAKADPESADLMDLLRSLGAQIDG